MLGPLASSPSAGSRDPAFAVDEGEFKAPGLGFNPKPPTILLREDRVSTGSTEKGPPDLDKEGFRVMVVTRFKRFRGQGSGFRGHGVDPRGQLEAALPCCTVHKLE